jgi:hypothetical protein
MAVQTTLVSSRQQARVPSAGYITACTGRRRTALTEVTRPKEEASSPLLVQDLGGWHFHSRSLDEGSHLSVEVNGLARR